MYHGYDPALAALLCGEDRLPVQPETPASPLPVLIILGLYAVTALLSTTALFWLAPSAG